MAIDYGKQRPRVTPPHLSVGHLRAALGLTIDAVCARMEEETGRPVTRGTISAIENGHRGASADTLAALEVAYGLPVGALTTQYEPRHRESAA